MYVSQVEQGKTHTLENAQWKVYDIESGKKLTSSVLTKELAYDLPVSAESLFSYGEEDAIKKIELRDNKLYCMLYSELVKVYKFNALK